MAALPSAARDVDVAQDVRSEVGQIDPIEGLRGVAVLWVVAFHWIVLRAGFDDPWIASLAPPGSPLGIVIGNGYLGVDLFFAITGFLLVLPWFRHAAEGRPAPAARPFYARRLRRIVPAYAVQLAILFFVFVPLLRGIPYWRQDFWFLLYNLGAHATFLHYTTPLSSASLGINGALWSLGLEMQYYLLLPLLAPLFVRRPWAMAVAMVAAAVAWRELAARDLRPLVDFHLSLAARWQVPEGAIRHFLATQLPGYLGHFAVGILCGRAWLAWRGRGVGGPAWDALAVAALAGLYLAHRAGSVPYLGPLTWLASLAAIGAVMLAWVSRRTAVGDALLANAPLRFVGRISYSGYLYHLPLLVFWNEYAPREWGGWSLPLYATLTGGVAWLSYNYVERPFLAARKVEREGREGDASGPAPGHSDGTSTRASP